MRKTKLLAAAMLAASVFGLSGMAQAAVVNCPADLYTNPTSRVEDPTGTTTAASACQYENSPDNSNVASISNINTAAFFGFNDWAANGGNEQVNVNEAATGTWAISGADFATFDYIIVFKDGAGTNLIAFLFNELFTNGVWSTPFTDPPFNLSGGSTAHNVSHYTIAQRTSTTTVPEPVSLALLGLGLAGMGIVRRRRRTND